jgi:DNA-binding CsgD family transcriptional regulator
MQSYQAGTHRQPDTAQQLTPRQREILQLLAEGRSVKEIAQILNISPRTVEFHKYNLISRLHLKNFPALVQFAIRHGITEAEPVDDGTPAEGK